MFLHQPAHNAAAAVFNGRLVDDSFHFLECAVWTYERTVLVAQATPLLTLGAIGFRTAAVASLLSLQRHAAALTLFTHGHSLRFRYTPLKILPLGTS